MILKSFRKWHDKWWWLTSLPTGGAIILGSWIWSGIGVVATTGYVDGEVKTVKVSLLLSRDGTTDILERLEKENIERLKADVGRTQDAIALRILNRQIEEANGKLTQYTKKRENIQFELKKLGWRED